MKPINYSKLKKHLAKMDAENKAAFALSCGTTFSYLKKRMYSQKPLGFDIARNIAAAGVMRPEELRPDDFFKYLW